MLDLKRIVLELQRRRVLRTVAACIVAGWVALQVRVDDTLSLREIAAALRVSKAVEGSVTRERAALVPGVRPHQRLRPCRRAGTIGESIRRPQIELAS